ncbi:MAG TPA: hypothetical protein PKD10_02700 [Paracoccaceae bacterium]|nr:hypothetical protein [Paracoccaceae bacterium]HMO72377.1 hypothetical protein [Paracoccaceae bacterium]
MLVGIVVIGIVSGLLAGLMAIAAGGSVALAVLAYAFFGSLGAVLWATASARRDQPRSALDVSEEQ